MIRIDRNRCIECGLCAQDCNSQVFRLQNKKPVVIREEWCNLCSHCISVCPKRAVIHDGFRRSNPPRIQRKLLDPSVYSQIVRSRRSVRHYKPKCPSRKLLEDILDLARHSPTASNAQNVHYTVVNRRALLDETSKRIFDLGDKIYRIYSSPPVKRLNQRFREVNAFQALESYAKRWTTYREQVAEGADLLFHHAPVLLLLHAPKGQGMAKDNCLIAATNIDNYASTLGLGACYIGLLVTVMQVDRKLHRKFGIPRDHRVHAALTLGYPAFRYTHHGVRKEPAVQWLSEET